MHRIKAILFDIDDTLYDLSIPFKEAFREFFPGEEMDLDGAFLASRKYSDRIYDRSLSGGISMEEMYIYRLGNAFRDYGKIIDGATALQFQSVYEKHQHNIRMTGEMEGLLEKLSKKTTLGIITNGPSEHQRDKVRALGLERWIPMERIWISGDLGIGKPHKEIFAAAQDKLGLKPEELCFVGDAYGHDILGARGAGWKAVWFNHRGRQATGEAEPDYEVRSEQDLIALLENPSKIRLQEF